MDYYDYREWVRWSEDEIREYAREIAADNSLNEDEASSLARQMVQQRTFGIIDYSPYLYAVDDPLEVNTNDGDRPDLSNEYRVKMIGSGLTRKRHISLVRESKFWKKERRHEKIQNYMQNIPYTWMMDGILELAEHARWIVNFYCISRDNWLEWDGYDQPYEGLAWYSDELMAAYHRARAEAKAGCIEAAMYHAFRAGELRAELQIRLKHGEFFDKYEAVRVAQQDAARSRKAVPNQSRIEAYQRHREAGNKRIEAGRLAAEELGLSETSIRNAFPGGKYPDD